MEKCKVKFVSRQEALDLIEKHYLEFFKDEANLLDPIRDSGFVRLFPKALKLWSDEEIVSFICEQSLLDHLFEGKDLPNYVGVNVAKEGELPTIEVCYTKQEWLKEKTHETN